jgi:Gas vesicle synthesis protein GvpO
MAASRETKTKLSPLDAAGAARSQVEELFGKPVESVTAIGRDGDRGWDVTVELVELERIPETTTLLGSYEVKLDGNGKLVEARRTRRYPRNQADGAPRKEDS